MNNNKENLGNIDKLKYDLNTTWGVNLSNVEKFDAKMTKNYILKGTKDMHERWNLLFRRTGTARVILSTCFQPIFLLHMYLVGIYYMYKFII